MKAIATRVTKGRIAESFPLHHLTEAQVRSGASRISPTYCSKFNGEFCNIFAFGLLWHMLSGMHKQACIPKLQVCLPTI